MSDAPAAAVEAAQPEAVEAPAAAVAGEEKVAAAETAEKPEETAEKPTETTPANGAAKPAAATAAADKANKDKGGKAGKNNRKFDPSVLPESEDHAAIRTQVHFYFSDSNLPTDKFLWEQTGGAENKAVALKTICQFGRMRRFKSYETVVAALRESKFVVVSGEAGAETVARKHAYNPDRPRSKIDAATVYAKGFGEEEPTTQVDLEAFFSQHGAVNAVRLRRTAENAFKGSVFVEFQDPEQAAAFLALDPPPRWKDQPLKIMSKPAYVAEKSQLIREGKIEPSNNSAPRFYEGRTLGGPRRGRGRGGSSGGGGGGAVDKNDWKKRRDDDRKNGFRGGRGGRGGGGGGGRGRGGGGHWNHKNRNSERETTTAATTTAAAAEAAPGGKPVIQATNEKGEPVVAAAAGKRSREEDGAEPPAKKVDSKAE